MRAELIEQLEPRRLYTATVAETSPGNWEITGDDTSESIIVSVDGVGRTFDYNGQTYGDGFLNRVSVFGKGGDDNISVMAVGDPGNVSAVIDAGDGNDTVFLNFAGGIWGGIGDDHLELWNSMYGTAEGEDGNDTIVLGGETFCAQVYGGYGNDVIDARQANYSNYLYGGVGDDLLYASNNGDVLTGDEGNDTLIGGSGDDSFYTGETVQGGGGYDVVYGNNTGGSYTGISEFVYT